MENPIKKFEKENELLIKEYLFAKKDNDAKSKKRLIIVGVGGVVLIMTICLLLEYIVEVSQNTLTIISLSLIVIWFFLTIASFAVSPKNLRSMYVELNSKAQKIAQEDFFTGIVSLLEKSFKLDKNFKRRLFESIKEQENWIENGEIITYQRIDDKFLLITKDEITYDLFYWAYTGDGFEIQYAPNFGWMEVKLSIEESDESKLTNK
ncbi:MAG: hypothetical protein WCG25_09095 [bacterium]